MTTTIFDRKAYQQQYYLDNKETVLDKVKIKRRMYRRIISELKMFPCMDCGVSYPSYVMDFDHRPGVDKKFVMADLNKVSSVSKLLEEIDKCDVVCSNCHRVRTHIRKEDI